MACCAVILFFVILEADSQLVPRVKKEMLIHRFMRSLVQFIESTPDMNVGDFSTQSLRYTNVCMNVNVDV